MRLLLDTHIAIWALNDTPDLSKRARELITSPNNIIYYSVISAWEILLKHARHSHNIPFDERDFILACEQAGFLPLPLSSNHVLTVTALYRPEDAPAHNDPFDRMLLAQAKAENMSFLTHDSLVPNYNEKCIIPV